MSALTTVAFAVRIILESRKRWVTRLLGLLLFILLPTFGGILYLWLAPKGEHGPWVWLAIAASLITTIVGFVASATQRSSSKYVVYDKSGKKVSLDKLNAEDIDGLIKTLKEDLFTVSGSESAKQPPGSNGPTKK